MFIEFRYVVKSLNERLIKGPIDRFIDRSLRKILLKTDLRYNNLILSEEGGLKINLVYYEYRIRWLPWPVIVPEQNIQCTINFKTYLDLFGERLKKTIREELRSALANEHQEIAEAIDAEIDRISSKTPFCCQDEVDAIIKEVGFEEVEFEQDQHPQD